MQINLNLNTNLKSYRLYATVFIEDLPEMKLINKNILSVESIFEKEVWEIPNLVLHSTRNKKVSLTPLFNAPPHIVGSETFTYGKKTYRAGDLVHFPDRSRFTRVVWSTARPRYILHNDALTTPIGDGSRSGENLFSTFKIIKISKDYAVLRGFKVMTSSIAPGEITVTPIRISLEIDSQGKLTSSLEEY